MVSLALMRGLNALALTQCRSITWHQLLRLNCESLDLGILVLPMFHMPSRNPFTLNRTWRLAALLHNISTFDLKLYTSEVGRSVQPAGSWRNAVWKWEECGHHHNRKQHGWNLSRFFFCVRLQKCFKEANADVVPCLTVGFSVQVLLLTCTCV